jgi:hypothetical protein
MAIYSKQMLRKQLLKYSIRILPHVQAEIIIIFITSSIILAKNVPSKDMESGYCIKQLRDACLCILLTGFLDSFISSVNVWQQYYDSQDIENIVLPHPWNKCLSTFQELIIVRVFRPDKVSGVTEHTRSSRWLHVVEIFLEKLIVSE